MLKKFRCLALVMALILVVVSGTTFAAKKPIKVIYGSVFQTQEIYGKGALYFKELVEKESKGRILVQFYPNNQLGSQAEMNQATKIGAQHMVISSTGELVSLYSLLGTLDLPYLFRDKDHYSKVADKVSSIIDQGKMAAESGVRILSIVHRTPRQLITKFPVNKLEDIKGIKMRVPQVATSAALWNALGTVTTVIPGGEVYTALATGTVDALENTLESLYQSKCHEQTKYVAWTNHKREFMPIVVNAKWWKSLTAAQRNIITKAMSKSTKMTNALVWESEEQFKKILKKEGMKFTQPDVVPFREKAKTIWGQFGDAQLIKKVEAVK
jgi:tripartite ATP-independent transporter DctP family solute receptor